MPNIEFLSNKEKLMIKKILRQSSLLKDINAGRNLLSLCGLNKFYQEFDIQENTSVFYDRLFELLYREYIPSKYNRLQSTLVVFLENLIKLDDSLSDEDKKIIVYLTNKIVKIIDLSNPIKDNKKDIIPIVVVAMNQQEAEELSKNYKHSLKEEEINFIETLHNNMLTKWVYHYHDTSEKWQPFITDYRDQKEAKKTIKELIETAFVQLKTSDSIEIEFKFFDIRELVKKENFAELEFVRRNECLVIVDSISIQNPEFRNKLELSGLEFFSNSLVVVIRPFLKPWQQIIDLVDQNLSKEFTNRFSLADDFKCEKVNDQIEFRRWLKVQSNYFLSQKESPLKPWNNFGEGGFI